MSIKEFDITIGLEVHVQLKTETKMFCSCGTSFGLEPNTQVCPICLGLPGTLPRVNEKAIEYGIKTALALHCSIPKKMRFDRKNYFYPDLPKGYQITQWQYPIAQHGYITIDTEQGKKQITIIRAHLEEDAGKLIHENGKSLVDLNRVGVPLLEIVSAPDMHTPQEAYDYLKELKSILEYLQVSDCNMQEGSLRCDANISVAPHGSKILGNKTEIKNLNSFHFVKKALSYEAERQIALLQHGERVKQATFTWLENENRTEEMRSKEYANDYRYFPEPDIPWIYISNDTIQQIKDNLPELPQERKQRWVQQYGLNEAEIDILISRLDEANYTEECMKLWNHGQEIIHWILGPMQNAYKDFNCNINNFPVAPQQLVELLQLIDNQTINRNTAIEIFKEMILHKKPASSFLNGKETITDRQKLEEICQSIIKNTPNFWQDYLKNPKSIHSILGKVMKHTNGRADAKIVHAILDDIIKQYNCQN